MSVETICIPDLSKRPYGLKASRLMPFSAEDLYAAWTTGFDKWFAAPGTVLMRAEVNAPFFFETVFKAEGSDVAERHPHYGRFLKLEPGKLVQLTWLTGNPGTLGAETVVTVKLSEQKDGTMLNLSHDGFADEPSKNGHAEAWPMVLEHMENSLSGSTKPFQK